MLTFSDSKSMAKALRKGLAERRIDISHSDSLELVARQFGFANWNMLAAKIEGLGPKLKLPDGWIISGGSPEVYRLGLDPELPGVVKIEAAEPPQRGGFATLMQSIDASDYIGKGLRFTAELRTRNAGKGCLWMRIDPARGDRHIRFDNMMFRKTNGALQGDVDWVERSVVLDVPKEAHSIHYGMLLNGPGELWARNLRVDEVDPSVATITETNYPRRPTNLEFGEAA
jgi:hypothetical protein